MREGLLFHWPNIHQLRLALPGMILLAAILHALALLLFTLVYPEPSPGTLRHGELTLLIPHLDKELSRSPWLQASDPALFSPTVSDPTLEELAIRPRFVPSFDLVKPQLLPLPKEPPLELPDVSPETGPVPYRSLLPSLPPGPAPAELSPPSTPGMTLVSGSSGTLTLPEEFAWPAEAVGAVEQPSVFLVAWNSSGNPVSVFLDHSSGARNFDELAEKTLHMSTFRSSSDSDGLRWTRISFVWDRNFAPHAEFQPPKQ